MEDQKLNYKHYPRSISWQVASVLNPSLQHSTPLSQQSKHSRKKHIMRNQSTEAPYESSSSSSGASKPWQEEESLPLPPQYVSPRELCKAMPKYMRVKHSDRRDQRSTSCDLKEAVTMASVSCSLGNLPFGAKYELAVGSPRSDHSSAKLTPKSVPESPKPVASNSVAAALASQQGTGGAAAKRRSSNGTGAASPAPPAPSPSNGPPLSAMMAAAAARASTSSAETTRPVSELHQNTPETVVLATSAGSRCGSFPHSPSAPRRNSGVHSPRIRSAATSPMHPSAAASRGLIDPASLQSQLTTLAAQNPEQLATHGQQRSVQTHSAAQGSPLSPAKKAADQNNNNNNNPGTLQRRESSNSSSTTSASNNNSPPTMAVALPPTPPTGRQRRTRRKPHPQEPTLETYRRISPNTYATNTVWNDRREQDSRDCEATQPRRTILIKSN